MPAVTSALERGQTEDVEGLAAGREPVRLSKEF
jgi:hypothetical protein